MSITFSKKWNKIILQYYIMAAGSFSLSGIVGSLFGSNKKSRRRSSRRRGSSRRRHICNSKCRHMKMYSNKYSKKYGRKRFNMRGG
jgi:hypothetical protein